MSAPIRTAPKGDAKKKKDAGGQTSRSTVTAPAPASAPPAPAPSVSPAPSPSATPQPQLQPPRSFVTRLLSFVSSMIGGLWSMVLSAIDRISEFVGDWLFLSLIHI